VRWGRDQLREAADQPQRWLHGSSGVRAVRKEDRGAGWSRSSFLVTCYLLVLKDHTLAAPIWLPARSATSAATIAL
jgi:hypothetical protein